MRAFVLAALLSASGAFAGASGINLQISLTSSNSAQLHFTAQPNTGYIIESRDSLSVGTWQALVVLDPAPTVQDVVFTDPSSAAAGLRFYRVSSSGGSLLKSATGRLATDSTLSLSAGAKVDAIPELSARNFTFDHVIVDSGAPRAVLSAEEVSVLAQRLANDEAERLYHVRPFLRNSPARWMSFRWVWRNRQGYGHADFEADVQFGPTADRPVVKVILIESQLSISF